MVKNGLYISNQVTRDTEHFKPWIHLMMGVTTLYAMVNSLLRYRCKCQHCVEYVPTAFLSSGFEGNEV